MNKILQAYIDARRQSKHPILRLVLQAIGVMFLAQVITVGILQVVSMGRRKKYQQHGGFPHPDFEPVCVGNNELQLYDYGQDLYDAMLKAIDEAQESIYIETYIWKGDEVGQAFKDHLARKAEQGIEVYAVFDGFGNTVVPRAFKDFPPDIHTLEYQPICRPWHVLDPRRYALDHRKLLIVDGNIGFIGGYNIGKLYATEWRDTHLRLEGPVVADLAYSFIGFWNKQDPQRRLIKRHYSRCFDPLITISGTSAVALMFPIRDMYIEAINRAEQTIYLTNAYFVPDGVLLDSLKEAASRGVDVHIIVPWVSNHIVVDWLARGYFTQCLEAGIHVYGYHNMLHAKTCTIDGQWSTIGTANLDRLSAVGNYEINVEVYSKDLAHQMEQLFERDTSNAFELSLEEWMKRPWYSTLAESILAPLRVMM